MTFKDLRAQISKLLPSGAEYEDNGFRIINEKPFWIWDQEQHRLEDIKTKGDCCFQHIIGLPIKNGKEYPFFDYEELIYNTIEQNQNIWIKKARGLGITTFLTRYFAWKILSSSQLDGQSIFIISGTREEFANYVKKKMEQLFESRFPNLVLDSKYTELTIKRTWIKVMPTKNIKDVRGYMDAAYLFIDEADYFNPKEQEELEPAIMAYEEKSNGKTIMVSTPNAPGGLFEKIEKDKNSKYTKLFLDYSYGLDKIYDREFIQRKQLEPEFEREYNLKYLGKIGNVFSTLKIDRALELGEQFKDVPVNQFTLHGCGIDPGFGSSKTAIVLTEHLKEEGKIRVLYAEEFDHPNPEDIADICFDLHRKYHNTWFFVDGANRGFITQLKVDFGESLNWEKAEDVSPHVNRVLPVNFMTDHKQMLTHLHLLINKEYLAIPKKYDKLILSLRTAIANEYKLDKEQTSYDDLLDAFRLSLRAYRME